MTKKTASADSIPAVTLDLVTERGWRGLSLAEIADRAHVPLPDVVAVFPGKAAILDAYLRSIDARMVAGELDLTDPARERLFEVLMRRFEAMAPRRSALATILRESGDDPLLLVHGAGRLAATMALALETAGLSSSGMKGVIRIKGLAAAYLYALRAFIRDDSADLGATMAALDRALGRIDTLARLIFAGRRSKEDAHEDESAPDTHTSGQQGTPASH